MVSVNLGSITTLESFGGILSSLRIKQLRISAPEFSFSNDFSNDFAIGTGFRLDRVVRSILHKSIISLEAFGSFSFPKYFLLYGIASKEKIGVQTLDYLHLYPVGKILYIVDEAKQRRLEKVAIKNVIIQKIYSSESMISGTSSSTPYRTWKGDYYSIIYEDTLGRFWEQHELTTDPESFFDWYTIARKTSSREVVSVNSLGKRKRNIDWSKSKMFSRKMAEKGTFQRIKIKKASVRKGNVLVYFDEKNNSWEENELVFETMANMLVKKFKEQKQEEEN